VCAVRCAGPPKQFFRKGFKSAKTFALLLKRQISKTAWLPRVQIPKPLFGGANLPNAQNSSKLSVSQNPRGRVPYGPHMRYVWPAHTWRVGPSAVHACSADRACCGLGNNAGRSGAGARALTAACPTDMRTSAEDAIGSQASSAGVPHTDRTGGRRPFSSAEAAGPALERSPSRPLSLPRSTPGARPCARGACATSETGTRAGGGVSGAGRRAATRGRGSQATRGRRNIRQASRHERARRRRRPTRGSERVPRRGAGPVADGRRCDAV